MDMNELKRREQWAELAASIAQADRNDEAKTRRRERLHWWRRHPFLTPWFCAAVEPVAAEPVPEAPAFVSGTGPGAAGSGDDIPDTVRPQPSGVVRRLAGPAGPGEPQLAVSSSLSARGRRTASEKPGPATPHLPPPLATRISAGITWT